MKNTFYWGVLATLVICPSVYPDSYQEKLALEECSIFLIEKTLVELDNNDDLADPIFKAKKIAYWNRCLKKCNQPKEYIAAAAIATAKRMQQNNEELAESTSSKRLAKVHIGIARKYEQVIITLNKPTSQTPPEEQ